MKYLILALFTLNAVAVEIKDNDVCFTKPEEIKLRQIALDKESCERKEIKLRDLMVADADLLKNKDSQIQIHKQTEYELIKKQERLEKQSTMEKTLWFIGGVLAGGASIYLGSKVTGK